MTRQLHLLADEGGARPSTRGPGAARRARRTVHRPISSKNRAIGQQGLARARAALDDARARASQAPTGLAAPSSSNARRRSAA